MKKALVMIFIACFAFSTGCSVANQGIPVSTDQSFAETSEYNTLEISNVDDFRSALNELSVNDTNLIKLLSKSGCCVSSGEINDADEINRIIALINSIEIEELSQNEADEINKKIDDFTQSIIPFGGSDDYCYFDFYGNKNINFGGFVVYWNADDFTDRTCIYTVSGKDYSITNMNEIKDELFSLLDCYI